MDNLPLELGDFIFQYLSSWDILKIAPYSPGYIGDVISLVLKLNFSEKDYDDDSLTDSHWQIINTKFRSLIDLNISWCDRISVNALYIKNMHLRVLDLSWTEIDGVELTIICHGKSRTTLEKLKLIRCQYISKIENGFNAISSLTNLKELIIRGTVINGDSLLTICQGTCQSTLETLDLAECRGIEERYFAELKLLTNLKKLNVRYTEIGDDALEIIKNNSDVTIDLENSNVNGQSDASDWEWEGCEPDSDSTLYLASYSDSSSVDGRDPGSYLGYF